MPRSPTEPDSRGLVSAIHKTHVDHRDKPGDDGKFVAKVVYLSWRRRWRMRRAAKQYARRLGPHLQRAYGAAEHYTVQQVCIAIGKLGLDTEFLALGCAVHLSEETFLSVAAQFSVYIPYEEARELVAKYRPHRLTSASANAETGLVS